MFGRCCDMAFCLLTHSGRVTHICVGNSTIIGSDNSLSPGRCQAIIGTNTGILLIGPLGTNFSDILIDVHTFSLKKMHLKMSSGKWRPFCLDLNVLQVFHPYSLCHDDVIKWKHFPHYWPFVRGIHRSRHKGQWCGSLMFSLICVWINGCVNNREAGD